MDKERIREFMAYHQQMRAEMATTDRLVFDDSKASLLTIHYALPRQ